MTRFQIRADGTIGINDEVPRVIENFELDSIITSKLKLNELMIFRIITEREAKYSEMVRVIDRLKAAKAEKISLSTR
jgi:biopolymer transport protein ExbD